jgi:hypothetical protein
MNILEKIVQTSKQRIKDYNDPFLRFILTKEQWIEFMLHDEPEYFSEKNNRKYLDLIYNHASTAELKKHQDHCWKLLEKEVQRSTK